MDKTIIIVLILLGGLAFFIAAAGGSYYYFNIYKKDTTSSSSQTKPNTSSSSSSSGSATTGPATTGPDTTGSATTGSATTGPATTGPDTTGSATTGPATSPTGGPPVSFNGYYDGLFNANIRSERNDGCKTAAKTLNETYTNAGQAWFKPIVAYTVKADGKCWFSDTNEIKGFKISTEGQPVTYTTKCVYDNMYPNNRCSNTPPSDVPETFNGYYGVGVDASGFTDARGHAGCKQALINQNNVSKKGYIAYSLKDNNHGALSNTCVFYDSTLSGPNVLMTSTEGKIQKVTTVCIDPKQYPNNFCKTTKP